MSITAIVRNFNFGGLVKIVTTDNLATSLGSNYITNQVANIALANEAVGVSTPFTWNTNDFIFLCASDGVSLCSINSTFTTLTSLATSANPFPINYATFTLTAAQFNGMYATPVSVLAGQGANTIIVPALISLELVYGTTQFAAGGPVGFQYGSTAHLGGVLATNTEAAADFTGATANTIYNFVNATGNSSQILKSSASNAALYISNSSGAFTTGDSTFTGKIFYRTISVT